MTQTPNTENQQKEGQFQPLIELYDSSGIGLIILFPSGVQYSNQAGGYACLHPTEEGVYVPLYNESDNQEEKLIDHFIGPKWSSSCYKGIDLETANFIDNVLISSPVTAFIRVDRNKLKDSYEAWIYVDVFQPERLIPVIHGFGECKGVLIWSNSD